MEEDEQEDIKLMNDFINKQKSSYQDNFQVEFEDFVSYKEDNSDQEDEDLFNEEEEPADKLLFQNKTELCTEKSNKGVLFTAEEQDIIDSCPDPDLKRMLILNRSKNMQLMKLQKKIQQFMIECDAEIEEKLSLLKSIPVKQGYQQTYIWKLTAPYFKDKKFFPAPRNDDAKRKRAGNELSVYDYVSSPKWTPIEFDRLTNAIKCSYNVNRQKSVVTKINTLRLKIQNDEGEDKALVEEMVKLKDQLKDLQNDDQVPPLNSNENIDWYKVAETFLKNKHTVLECQSVWHMLVHPQINKSEWTDQENKRLEEIAKIYSYQNWDSIALELHTNRTGFTACLHYFSKLCDKFKKSKFTLDEDNFLLEVVDIYKMGNFIPWNKVVCHFTNRSRHQLYHRYTYFLSQNHVKRGKFSEAEDILLIILVNKFGRNFKKCAEYMPHRSQIQLKSRYNSNLQRPIKKGTFTSEDDQIIYDYAQKYGEKSWSGLTGKLNRCNAQIRQRYKLIKTFLRDYPDAKLADIPKRRHRFVEGNEDQYNFLNYIAAQYEDVSYIPTLAMIEECLQSELAIPSTRFSQNRTNDASESSDVKLKNIDALLTDFFAESMAKRNSQAITETSLKEATENAATVLELLGAKLDIPPDLECDSDLDNIDLEILESLSKKSTIAGRSETTDKSEITKLCPPSLSTLVGLRTMILQHKEYKSEQKENGFASTSTFEDKSLALAEEDSVVSSETEDLHHRNVFCKRFESLFYWSAVLSVEKPNQNVPEQPRPDTSISVVPEKVVHKRPSPQTYPTPKKRKISVSALANLTHHPQLKLVDKDVVERLIKKNKINVIRIESVMGSDGVKKSILKSDHTVGATSNVVPACDDRTQISDPLDLDDTNDVTNNDLHDVVALDNILMRMKSEVHNESSCSGEEYQNIEDDVQLLKQALKHEKLRVKPDPD